jgi:hypothetical protein
MVKFNPSLSLEDLEYIRDMQGYTPESEPGAYLPSYELGDNVTKAVASFYYEKTGRVLDNLAVSSVMYMVRLLLDNVIDWGDR